MIDAVSSQPDLENSHNLSSRVLSAAFWNQALWTTGYSLTSGGFLTYFGAELGARGFAIALLLAIPETVGITAVFSRLLISTLGGRKRVWFVFSLLARFVSIGIPLLAFPWFRPNSFNPLCLMIGFLAISHASQAIAYVAYISWIADLVPQPRWGYLFSRRNIAKMALLIVVPTAGGFARDWWRNSVDEETALLAYVVSFATGIAIQLLAMLPLLRLPDVPTVAAVRSESTWSRIGRAFCDRSMRFLLIHSWWLAFFNGMTQAAFFGLLFRVLHVSLGVYYLLADTMYLISIPVSLLAGSISDRYGDKRLLIVSLLIASAALPFWFFATPSLWGLVFGAYILWSAYAAANISGRNLLLRLAPQGDNSADFALFRQVGGMIAGISGVMGGIWLDRLNQTEFHWAVGDFAIGSYQLLFLVSWLGRMAAVLWLIPITEPRVRRNS